MTTIPIPSSEQGLLQPHGLGILTDLPQLILSQQLDCLFGIPSATLGGPVIHSGQGLLGPCRNDLGRLSGQSETGTSMST